MTKQRNTAPASLLEHMPPVPLDKLLKPTADGILLTVKVSPKSHQDTIKGVVELSHNRLGLAIRVSPPAADGAANEAVVDLIAKFFRVPRSCVEIKSGTTSRIKTVGVRGDRVALQTILAKSFEARPFER